MKPWTWLRLIGIVGAYCGCGGAEFTVSVFPDSGPALTAADAGDVGDDAQGSEDAHPAMTTDGSTTGDAFKLAHHDAGVLEEHDAAAAVDSPAPAADSGSSSPPAGDAADESSPPPPALCCMTPCGGSTPAPITCGNGPAWTCAAGSCSDRACAVGAVCDWMGTTCAGRVAVCP